MKISSIISGMVAMSLLLLQAACNHGGDDDTPSVRKAVDLSGSYYGTIYRASGVVETVNIQIAANQLLSLSLNGVVQNGYSASISLAGQAEKMYTVTDALGHQAALSVTNDGAHIAYILPQGENFDIGILEKNASANSIYSADTLLGTWSGLQYHLDSALTIKSYGQGSSSTALDGGFSGYGIDGGFKSVNKAVFDSTMNPTLGVSNGSLGLVLATMSINASNLDFKALISADGTAAVAWGCVTGSADFANCGFSVLEKSNNMFNVELVQFTTTAINDVAQRHFQLTLGAIGAGAIPCQVTRPYASTMTCSNAGYDSVNQLLTIPVSGFGDISQLTIDLSTQDFEMPVTTDGTNFRGGAIFAQTHLDVRTQSTQSGTDYTVVVLSNPDPSFRKAVLTGAGTGAMTLWDNNYSSVYDSFYQDLLDDGVPAGIGAYVGIDSSGSGHIFNTGLYKVVLSDNADHPGLTQSYTFKYSGASASGLLSGNAPTRGDITIAGVAMNGATFNSPGTLLETPGEVPTYVLTWPNTAVDSANTYWQVRFRVVNGGANNHLKNREYRSGRMLNFNGIVLDPITNIYTWVGPLDFANTLESGDVIKIQLRASNKDNSVATQSEGVYVLPPLAQ